MFDPDATPKVFMPHYSYTRYHLAPHNMLHVDVCKHPVKLRLENSLELVIDELLVSAPAVQLYLTSMTVHYIRRPSPHPIPLGTEPYKTVLNLFEMAQLINTECMRSEHTRYQKWSRLLSTLPLTPLKYLFFKILLQSATQEDVHHVHKALNMMYTDLSLKRAMHLLQDEFTINVMQLQETDSPQLKMLMDNPKRMYSIFEIIMDYSHLLEPSIEKQQLDVWQKNVLLIQARFQAQPKDQKETDEEIVKITKTVVDDSNEDLIALFYLGICIFSILFMLVFIFIASVGVLLEWIIHVGGNFNVMANRV